MQSPIAGWYQRASPYTAPFFPTRTALQLAILRNAPAEPEGLTLALFNSPANIAVDSAGKVLALQEADFSGLVALTERTKDLPPTGSFRNTWVIDQPVTSRPIERILLPTVEYDGAGDESDYFQVSVQGFDGVTTRLRKPVGTIQTLPVVLQKLVGLLLESRGGGNEDRDEVMIDQVKSVLGNVF